LLSCNLFVYGKTVSDAYCEANRAVLNLSKWSMD